MKNKIYVIGLGILILFFSYLLYQGSDSIKIKQAVKTVKGFSITTTVQTEGIWKFYPSLETIGKFNYWPLNNLQIETDKIYINSNDEIFIPCIVSEFRNIVFVISRKNTSEIIKSKGFINNNEYLCEYLKNIRAINTYDYDISIYNVCKNYESEFETLVNNITNKMKNNIRIKRNNISGSYGFYSGSIVIENKNSIGFSYGDIKLYCDFLDRNKELISRNEINIILTPLNASSEVSYDIHIAPAHRFIRVNSEINRDFIKKYVSENAEGINGLYSFNL